MSGIEMQARDGLLAFLAVLTLGVAGACAKEQSTFATETSEHRLNGRNVGDMFSDTDVANLAAAACEGRTADVLQSRGRVNPNSRGLDGITPLLWAQDCRSLAGVDALLQVGADPNQNTGGGHGFTPVCIAAGLEDPAFLALLLRHGGDPDASYEGGVHTALRLAFERGMLGDWTNYNALIEAGADINRPHAMQTIAEFAAAMNYYDKVAQLLQRGYNHNLPRLALYVQTIHVGVMEPSQVTWAARVRSMLEERGVRFPVRPEDAGIRRPAPNGQ